MHHSVSIHFYFYVYLLAMASISFASKTPEEAVLINFPRKFNITNLMSRKFYLPPEVSHQVHSSEVIDKKIKSISYSILSDSAQISENSPLPEINLQTPLQSVGERDRRLYSRPVHIRTKPLQPVEDERKIEADVNSAFIKINDISCEHSEKDIYFRASLVSYKNVDQPVIENVGNELCKIEKIKNEYYINFGRDRFWNCGVIDCSTEFGKLYCLSLRFPSISGLRLKEDFKITLQCKLQERTASHTKKINVKSLDTTARMVPRVATGGYKNSFETDVGLYRKTYKSEHIFDAKIETGGTVVLGEELLLRVVVREGDGWHYSKISDVTIYYVEKRQQKKIMNSLWILDSNGCLNPQVHEICSREQFRVSPLESYLMFEAFMFENMKENDEMVMSVKIIGCADGTDCVLNCLAGHVRKSRSLENNRKHQNHTANWQNDVAFRVIFPKESISDNLSTDFLLIIPYILSLLFFLLIVIILSLINAGLKMR